jgi:hypothetical protein
MVGKIYELGFDGFKSFFKGLLVSITRHERISTVDQNQDQCV